MKNVKKFENCGVIYYNEEEIEISDQVKACLPHLKRVNNEISWEEVLGWFNENDIEYAHLRDLDMYIIYIEENSKDFLGV